MNKSVIDVLRERGFVEAMTTPDLPLIAQVPIKVYCGFDPTSDSLHLGNLIAIMGLAWFQRYGHSVFAIVGGATGMVGDPSGKSQERPQMSEENIAHNLVGIRENLERVLSGSSENKGSLSVLNNYDWMKQFSFLGFLRDVGKYFRVGVMLSKESVKNRLASEDGMSFTEFSYQLLQGYDFLHLFQEHGVSLQLGGSDQWGNITAGIELIRKVLGKPAFGLTFPLLTRSDGQKFGKSEQGAVWLSSDKLSPYEFYQYLVRVTDEDVIKLMRMLTFMEMDEIHSWQYKMSAPNYEAHTAQKKLAEEVTGLVHGPENVLKVLFATQHIAPGKSTQISSAAIEAIAEDIPRALLSKGSVIGKKLVDVLVEAGFQKSKGEVKRLIANGGVYLNNQKILDDQYLIGDLDCIEGRFLLFAMGKKNKALVEFLN